MSTYKLKDYQIFLDNNFIKKTISRNIKKYFPGADKCLDVESKHFKVIADTSFLVRYFFTLEDKKGHQWKAEARGNRLNSTSYKILEKLWQKHKYTRYYYPRPIKYFPKKQFVLYENYGGMIHRDWPKKSAYHLNKTIPMIALRLAGLHNTKISFAKPKTLDQEISSINVILRKVKKNINKYHPTAEKAAKKLKKFLKNNYDKSKFVLSHNDFQSSNIIYNPKGAHIGIIDFEMMANFFPAADIANFNVQLITMIKNFFPAEKIIYFQNKFIKEYSLHVSQTRMDEIKKDLPYFETKSILDILALYSVYLSLRRGSHQEKILKNSIAYYYDRLKNLLSTLE